MADRFRTQGIIGLLASHVDVDHAVAYVAESGQLTSWWPEVLTPPSGGDCIVELNTSTGGQAGGASGLVATIPDGANAPLVDVQGGVAFGTGTTLYMRVTQDSGAGYLSGLLSHDRVASTPTAGELTTVDRVKQFLNLSGTSQDAFLATLISGVSNLFREWTGRDFDLRTYVRKLDAPQWPDLVLPHWPIAAVNRVTEHGTDLVLDVDYEIEAERGTLVRVASGIPMRWMGGSRGVEVDWDGGYADIPQDIQLAADRQTAHVYMQSVPSEKGRIGLKGFTNVQGGTEDYEPGSLLPEVAETLHQYKRAF